MSDCLALATLAAKEHRLSFDNHLENRTHLAEASLLVNGTIDLRLGQRTVFSIELRERSADASLLRRR